MHGAVSARQRSPGLWHHLSCSDSSVQGKEAYISSFALALALALSACQSHGVHTWMAAPVRRVPAGAARSTRRGATRRGATRRGRLGGGVRHLQLGFPVLRAHVLVIVLLVVRVVDVVDAVGRLRLVVVVVLLL